MLRAYFVSDLHIASADDPKARLFRRFLQSLSDNVAPSHLFLLGDIFDMWLADHRYFVDRYREIIGEIERLQQAGVEIHYFEGNHDLHLRKFWAGELGVKVHSGPVYVTLHDRTLRLEHGDQMDPDDRGYRFLRWFLRTPAMKFLIYNLPGTLAATIGERASARSRHYTSRTKTITNDDAIAKIRVHAERAHKDRHFDLIVSGHVHVRDDYQFDTATGRVRSINLGTWLDAPCCLRIDDSGPRLIELSADDMAQLPTSEPATAADIT